MEKLTNEQKNIYNNKLNPEQKNACDMIIKGEDVCIFGKGGSGKSFIIDTIVDDKTLLLAPTGMAAINLSEKAMTIHSALKIGEKSLLAWNWEKVKNHLEDDNKIKILENFMNKFKRIVFDEGSMIISGLFNTFIQITHTIYGTTSAEPFEKFQIIMLLDPLQLPPIKNEETLLDLESYKKKSKLSKSDYIVNNPDFKKLFHKDLDNIIHLKQNMRNKDPEWDKVLDACRTGFNLCDYTEKVRLLELLNSRVLTKKELFHNNVLRELYENNTKTSYTKKFIEDINNKHLDNLIEKNNGVYYSIDRDIITDKKKFCNKMDGYYTDPKKLFNNLVNYMDDLGGYFSIKEKDEKTNRWFIKTEFRITIGQRIMLRSNNLHKQIKTGSLGYITNTIINDNSVEQIEVKFDSLDNNIIINRIDFKHPEFSEIIISAFPLIPATAITIHKLQGQTFESKLFIQYCEENVPYIYEHEHLLYTAISRNKNKEDIYIISDTKLTEKHFPVNKELFRWYIENI